VGNYPRPRQNPAAFADIRKLNNQGDPCPPDLNRWVKNIMLKNFAVSIFFCVAPGRFLPHRNMNGFSIEEPILERKVSVDATNDLPF
jgi:hypothetical protein